LILLSGPPSLLIVVQPGVEVNAVENASAAEANCGDFEGVEQRDSDAEVVRRFGLGEAADRWPGERGIFHW